MNDARRKADTEPLRLDQNWAAAVTFFSCWVAVGCLFLYKILTLLGFVVWIAKAVVIVGAIGAVCAFGVWAFREVQRVRAERGESFNLVLLLKGMFGRRGEGAAGSQEESLLGGEQPEQDRVPVV